MDDVLDAVMQSTLKGDSPSWLLSLNQHTVAADDGSNLQKSNNPLYPPLKSSSKIVIGPFTCGPTRLKPDASHSVNLRG